MRTFSFRLVSGLFLLFGSLLAYAQQPVNPAGAVLPDNSPRIEILYGSSFSQRFAMGLYSILGFDDQVSIENTRKIGHMYLRADFPLRNSSWSLGGEVGYYNLVQRITFADPSADSIETQIQKVWVLPRAALHLDHNPRIDPYFMFGFGFLSAKIVGINISTNVTDTITNQNALLPIGIRLGFGMRVAVSPQLSVVGETALGGALLSAGLSWRLIPNPQLIKKPE